MRSNVPSASQHLVRSSAPLSQPNKGRESIPCARSDGSPPQRGCENWAVLIRSGLGLGRVDLDAAFEMGAVLDADPRRGNVAADRAVLSNVHAAAGVHVAHYLAGDDHFARVNFGIELGRGADDQFM